jgi:hypothetical protein
LQVLAQQGGHILCAAGLGIGDQRLVDRDLVVLGLGGGGQDHGVHDGVVGFLDRRLALGLQALDRRARRVVDLLAEQAEGRLDVLDVLVGFLGVSAQ